SAAASAADDKRFNDIGSKIQCSCGCGQMLLKCNHVGCPSSDSMIRQLRTAVATYSNEEDVLNWFRRNYGMTVVVEPAKHGFELIIWVVPPLLVATALLLVFWIIQRWRMRAVPVAAAPVDPHMEALRERARKETEL
ncbi:MAG TPA: cytochrome c-type biogenesis protein CcmH, partial [Candidatus Angelobacter sp.]